MPDASQGERSTSKQQPPAYVLKHVGTTFTGIWMGWRWVNGKPVGKAPPVER